jgi:type IV secretory pathway VirB2 component (pilin)
MTVGPFHSRAKGQQGWPRFLAIIILILCISLAVGVFLDWGMAAAVFSGLVGVLLSARTAGADD